MNKEALTIFENAARRYCNKTGIDPDEHVPLRNELVLGVPKLVPKWHFAAMELFDLSLKITALREAGGQKPPTVQ